MHVPSFSGDPHAEGLGLTHAPFPTPSPPGGFMLSSARDWKHKTEPTLLPDSSHVCTLSRLSRDFFEGSVIRTAA